MSKICKKCGESKDESEFSKHAISKDGLAYDCKSCINKAHQEKSEYYTSKSMEWREKNFDQWKKNSAKAKIRQLIKVVFEECRVTNVNRFLKTVSTDLKTLKAHTEQFFLEGVSWENYGTVWTFDFVKPLDEFDLLLKEERIAAANYTNLKIKII